MGQAVGSGIQLGITVATIPGLDRYRIRTRSAVASKELQNVGRWPRMTFAGQL